MIQDEQALDFKRANKLVHVAPIFQNSLHTFEFESNPHLNWIPTAVIDGAWIKSSLHAATSWVVHRTEGISVLEGGAQFLLAQSATQAECWACLHCLQWATSQGIQSICINTDSVLLVSYLRDELKTPVAVQSILDAIRLAVSGFLFCSVCKVDRSCVSEAHYLATQSTSAMATGWKRTMGNVRSFIGNSMGGLRGRTNLASWVVAGTLAYYLWVKPSQQLKREQEERAALAAASDRYRYVEKRKPMPDPQQSGLIYGNKDKAKDSEA